MFPRNENRNKGTFACSFGTKTRMRAHSPKPPFYETALLSPNDPFGICRQKRQNYFSEVSGCSGRLFGRLSGPTNSASCPRNHNAQENAKVEDKQKPHVMKSSPNRKQKTETSPWTVIHMQNRCFFLRAFRSQPLELQGPTRKPRHASVLNTHSQFPHFTAYEC